MIATLSFPRTDSALLGWAQNIVTLVTPTPANWGLVTSDVTAFNSLVTAYQTALAACEPSQRSKPAVVAKNQARTNLKAGATIVANKVYADAAVTDAMKTQLGIPPRATPHPIPAPTDSPTIKILSATGWTVQIRLTDAVGGNRGKPAGTFGASVFSFVGETAPTDISAWRFEGSTGRVNKIDITFANTLAAGTKVWFTGFFFNGRKQSGPACPPIPTNLPGGSVAMAA